MKTKLKSIVTLLMVLIVQLSFAQEKTISGLVSDEMGPITDISVKVKGTSRGTITDFNGNYSIKASIGDTLIFTHLSYETVEKTIKSSNQINVILKGKGEELTEVIINVAYGQQKKEDITGAVKVISTKEIAKIQSANIVQGMTGKVAGVQIVQSSGQPGSAPIVRFRGIGSINAASSPLYVLDGVPFNGDINSLNALDIESTTFLKDAAAAALYGNRGANGVIIITTKKGKLGDIKITFDSKVGYTKRSTKDYDMITSPEDYLVARYNAVRNSFIFNNGLDPQTAANVASQNLITNNNDLGTGVSTATALAYNPYDLDENLLIDPNTGKFNPNAKLLYHESWEDYLFKPSIKTESFLSISKADEKTNFYFSLGYGDNKGYVVNSGFKRITTQLKMSTQAFKSLKVGGSFNYANTFKKNVGGDGSTNYSNPLGWARSIAPIYPIHAYDDDGNLILDINGNSQFDDGTGNIAPHVRAYGQIQNPAATIKLNVNESKIDNLTMRAFADYDITKDLKFTYNITGELYNSNYFSLTNPLIGDSSDPDINGRVNTSNTRFFTLTQQQLLNWKKDFNKHSFTFLFGHENSNLNMRVLYASKTNLLLPNSTYLDHAAKNNDIINYERDYNLDGYFSRLSYDFDKKYYLNGSIRRDASSVFSPENRWGTFFGIGAAWRVSQEKFLQDNRFINDLKLKVSYGEQGNDAIIYFDGGRNYYAYKDQYELADTSDGSIALNLVYRGNKDLTWETNQNFNIGFDSRFFNKRLGVEIEYFTRKVSDMLYNLPSPPSEGLPPKPVNIGDMENKGYEITLNGDIVKTDHLTWNVNLNTTHYKNKITKLPRPDQVSGFYKFNVGKSRYEYFIREYAGVNPNNGAALYYQDILDTNGEPTGNRQLTENISQATKYYIGKTATPDFYGGFSTAITYKDFDVSVNFAYQIGGYGYDRAYWNRLGSDHGENYHKDALTQTWTPENPNAKLPRLDADESQFRGGSDMFLIESSYLSLQNVNVGFNIPSKFIQDIGFNSIRVYAVANNLALWSKRQGYDPRLSLTGSSRDGYSILSTTSLGLTLNF